MNHKLNLVLALVVIFVGLPFGWFMLDSSTNTQATQPVTIGQLRGLAGSLQGPFPSEARYETIGRRRMIGDLLAAGSGLRPVAFAIRAYELVLPGGRPITIDRGMSRRLAESHRVSDFDPIAQARVDHAVASSRMNLLLSNGLQHSGSQSGLSQSANRRSATTAETPFAVAPGVVVIPADGIMLGERMVYARLSDGRELLFAGDVAATNVSWMEQRPPARLSTSFLAPSDREQAAAWLRTIELLKEASPSLQIIPGHDTALPRIVKHGFVTLAGQ